MPLFHEKKAKLTPEPKEDQSNLDAITRIIRFSITFPTCQRVDANLIIQASVAGACERTSISELCRKDGRFTFSHHVFKNTSSA